MSVPAPNLLIDLVDWRTGRIIETQLVWDPHLEIIGNRIRIGPGCGRPTDEWLQQMRREGKLR